MLDLIQEYKDAGKEKVPFDLEKTRRKYADGDFVI
jgi:hypothetical protein